MIATIQSITPVGDGTGTGIVFQVVVDFSDATTGFSSTKTYNFALNTSQATAVAAITADATTLKNNLAQLTNLQSKVGATITV